VGTRIIFNGQEYPSTDAMPDAVRQSYFQALAQFADADRNGIPDVLELGKAGNVIGIQHSSITVNGRTYENEDEMPALVRAIYKHALGRVGSNLLPNTARILDSKVLSAPQSSDRNEPPADQGFIRALDKTRDWMERVMQVLLGMCFVSTLGGAVFLLLHMGRSHQRERLYVAIAALLLLGTLDTQAERLVQRRMAFSLEPTEAERRYSGFSLPLLLAAACVLIGLALFLP
jgi:hypothetical protein